MLERVLTLTLIPLGYREHLEGMLSAMVEGDLEALQAYSRAGDFLDVHMDEIEQVLAVTT